MGFYPTCRLLSQTSGKRYVWLQVRYPSDLANIWRLEAQPGGDFLQLADSAWAVVIRNHVKVMVWTENPLLYLIGSLLLSGLFDFQLPLTYQ